MKLLRMTPDPTEDPAAFDPGFEEFWRRGAKTMYTMDQPWLNLCNMAQYVFLHAGVPVKGVMIAFETPIGTAAFDSLDLASYWLMCMDERWRQANP